MRKNWALSALLPAGLIAAALSWPAGLLAQCAMCRATLANSDEGRRWAQGIDSGVILLLLAPFLIFSAIFLRIYSRQVKAALWKRLRQCREACSRMKPTFARAAKSL